MYNRETINELNVLSKTVFGRSSKWRKLVEKGELEPAMEITKKLDIVTGKTEEIQTQIMHVGKNGGEIPKIILNRYTVESIKERMLAIKVQQDNLRGAIQKFQEEERAKKQAEQNALNTLSRGSGSAAV